MVGMSECECSAVGACRPDWQELDSNLMRSSVVYCDSREACLREAGDIIISGVTLKLSSVAAMFYNDAVT